MRSPAIHQVTPRDRILEELASVCWPFELAAGERDRALGRAEATLEALEALGLAPSQPVDGVVCYDNLEVLNGIKRLGLEHATGAWASYLEARRRMLLEHWPGAPGEMTAAPHARRFELSLTRDYGPSVAASHGRLRLPFPVTDRALPGGFSTDAQLLSLEAPPLRGEPRFEPGRLGLQVLDARAPLRVSLRFAFNATLRPPAAPAAPAESDLSADERALYLKTAEDLVQVTPRVRQLAHALAHGLPPDAAVRALFRFFFRHRAGFIHYDRVDASNPLATVMEDGGFDCYLGSAVLVALCRALEIPARRISGSFLYPNAPAIHHWSEFWDGARWVPVDVTGWDLAAGDVESPWAFSLFGQLDHRLTTQVLPRIFTGNVGVALPPVWSMVQRTPAEGGTELEYSSSGALLYRDQVRVVSRQLP